VETAFGVQKNQRFLPEKKQSIKAKGKGIAYNSEYIQRFLRSPIK